MSYTKTLKREKYLKELIEKQCTGTPKELAVKMEISESTVYRILKALKELGEPIDYSESKNTYYYK